MDLSILKHPFDGSPIDLWLVFDSDSDSVRFGGWGSLGWVHHVRKGLPAFRLGLRAPRRESIPSCRPFHAYNQFPHGRFPAKKHAPIKEQRFVCIAQCVSNSLHPAFFIALVEVLKYAQSSANQTLLVPRIARSPHSFIWGRGG